MGRRKAKPQPLPEGWVVSEEFAWNGRSIVPGTELSITGERASRFRFLRHVVTPSAEWIDVVGGTKSCRQWRSFRPEKIKRVHRIAKTMTAQEARELVNSKNRQKREKAVD